MRAQEDNIKSVPPSDISLLQDQNRINLPHYLSKYRVFLYSEVKRTSNHPVTIADINHFINSPEGQKGLSLFISTRVQPKEKTRPKAIGESLKPQFRHSPQILGSAL